MIAKIVRPDGGIIYKSGDTILIAPEASAKNPVDAKILHLSTYDKNGFEPPGDDGTPTSTTTIQPDTEVFIMNDQGATVDRINRRIA